MPRELSFLAPVQEQGSALNIELANLDEAFFRAASTSWRYRLAGGRRAGNLGFRLARWPQHHAVGRLDWRLDASRLGRLALAQRRAAVHLGDDCVPAAARRSARPATALGKLPAPRGHRPLPTGAAGAAAVAALLLGGLVFLNFGCSSMTTNNTRAKSPAPKAGEPAFAESVIQQIRVEDKYVLATAKIHWPAARGQSLPSLLYDPAVLTKVTYPTRALKLVSSGPGERRSQNLLAQEDGTLRHRIAVSIAGHQSQNGESGFWFNFPTQYGLVNQLQLTLVNLDVDVDSAQAVSVERVNDNDSTNTVAKLALAPSGNVWIGWKPRTRDARKEKAVFYADTYQLYVPSAGVIEGAHHVSIRPAQGELSELVFNVPPGTTITDVLGPANGATPLVSLWRFDPDARKLRVNLRTAQSRAFNLLIRSQVPTGPLPFEHQVGLLAVENARESIGLLGVATGNEVQMDNVTTTDGASAITLQDFPSSLMLQLLSAQIPGLTVRSAFRYSDARATATLKASAVEPGRSAWTRTTRSRSARTARCSRPMPMSPSPARVFSG